MTLNDGSLFIVMEIKKVRLYPVWRMKERA